MNEHESSEPSLLTGEKKSWATPEIRDQSIKSATTKGKFTSVTEGSPTAGPVS